ncbi:hypothetical protein FS749_000598 [Ceratobasidium sp. UAMH 11750]|nr:hypothetical protein FS749_000598 [Ceratobasidium sp. UAMH 11750]
MVLSAARVVLKRNHPDAAQDDDSAKLPQLLEELNLLFSSQGAKCSIESLENLANQVYKEYLTTEAYQLAHSPNGDPEPSAADLENILAQNMENLCLDFADGVGSSRSLTEHRQNLPNTSVLPSSSLSGDGVLANNKLLMRECFFMAEYDAAMTEGDPGRMLKIMNVFLFGFWGTNSINYGNKLLEMTCNFKYEYPPNMKQAIIDNMLMNPSGLPKHWQAGDLLQEHHNLKIKTIYNSKSSNFDD